MGEQIELPTLATAEMDDSELTSEEEFPWGGRVIYVFFGLVWRVCCSYFWWFGVGWSGCFGEDVTIFNGKTKMSALITLNKANVEDRFLMFLFPNVGTIRVLVSCLLQLPPCRILRFGGGRLLITPNRFVEYLFCKNWARLLH